MTLGHHLLSCLDEKADAVLTRLQYDLLHFPASGCVEADVHCRCGVRDTTIVEEYTFVMLPPCLMRTSTQRM